MKKPTPLDQAKSQWKEASDAHVNSTAGVREAQEALGRLKGLIATEQASLASAKTEQRAGILAAFGFRASAPEQAESVADVQARIDALESVVPEHEATVQLAQAVHAATDAAVRHAEKAILLAKAKQAVDVETKAFEAFKAAHLHRLAVGAALNDRDLAAMQPRGGYWGERLYGDRHHIEYTAPGLDAATADLIAQAEQGK
ncbi:hypothetical protein [Comamonas antarctica]|uniref:Uncharacterized protein n=1 Tax=Comamonas antarctica TaxID=2743470 RepID=A0A6N1WXT4_9BURK|nr:hypothetical protein [Comamonas antarctica]QKV52034.1 hypothetical protein HUK68_03465 [Comamonas antarctica]